MATVLVEPLHQLELRERSARLDAWEEAIDDFIDGDSHRTPCSVAGVTFGARLVKLS